LITRKTKKGRLEVPLFFMAFPLLIISWPLSATASTDSLEAGIPDSDSGREAA
jgi:hypothetical protein